MLADRTKLDHAVADLKIYPTWKAQLLQDDLSGEWFDPICGARNARIYGEIFRDLRGLNPKFTRPISGFPDSLRTCILFCLFAAGWGLALPRQ